MVAPRREAQQSDQLGSPALDLGPGTLSDETGNADILERCELGQKMVELEDEPDPLVAER